jgi:hypothetical protein
MRTVRIIATLACVSGALLVGASSPALAEAPAGKQRPAVSSSFHFGTYYTIEACRYFGESLVAGPQFSSYSCQPYWYPNDPNTYWALYVYA